MKYVIKVVDKNGNWQADSIGYMKIYNLDK